MTGNIQALKALIDELDRNLAVCDAVVEGAHWHLVEDIAGRRARAAATLRAMMRWYGECVPPRCPSSSTVGPMAPRDLIAADRRLLRAYDHAFQVAAAGAHESRLLAEQLATVRRDHAEMIKQLSPVARISQPRMDAGYA